jgi:hypothetical protein
MTGSVWGDRALLAVLVLAAALSVLRLRTERARPGGPRSYLTGWEADLAHLVMNLGMAAMLTAWWGPRLRTGLVALFGAVGLACVAGLALAAARPDPVRRAGRPALAYHLVAAAAMVYATVLMPVGPDSGTAGMPGMAGMPMMPEARDMPGMSGMAPMTAPTGASVAAWLLAALFTLDALVTVVVVAARPALALSAVPAPAGAPADRAPEVDGRLVRSLRLGALPHVVMDVAMVIMLVGG